jgi:NAD(P)-dependent dehydrogenase (short-subunit alcohol dehydrogenase family)
MTSPPAAPLSNGPVVLVLDAGTDHGFTIARALLEAGCLVVATDRHAKDLVRICHGYSGDRVLLVAADVTDPGQLTRLLSRGRERFGRIDCAVAPNVTNPRREPLRLPYVLAA